MIRRNKQQEAQAPATPEAVQPEGEAAKTRPKPLSLWRGILSVGLIAAAALLAVSFVAVCLMYRTVRPFLRIELGDPAPLAEEYLRDDAEADYLVVPRIRDRAGTYILKIQKGRISLPVLLIVRDTIPPAAEGAEQTISTKETPTADRFVKKLTDQSVVKLTYEVAPVFGRVGDYTAIIRLEDASGNVTRVPAEAHVRIARESVACEAGEPAPDASAFLIDDYAIADATEITDAMMRTPGVYPISMTADGTPVESLLIVQDTVAPQASGVTRVVDPDETLLPEMLVKDLYDETQVTVRFIDEPDPEARAAQAVRIEITDLGGNRTEIVSNVLFSNVQPMQVEASDQPLSVVQCLAPGSYKTASFVVPFIPDVPGTHAVHMVIDGEENLAVIEVRDTVAPALRVERTEWYVDAPAEASFFAAAEDMTATELRFLSEPDWTRAWQTVTVVATDAGGNETQKKFTLRLSRDAEPPALYGARDRFAYVDEAVAYRKDVWAEDNCDGPVEVTVDASLADPTQLGTYPVTYTATDRAGNTTSCTVQFTFVKAKVTEETAEAVAQRILKRVLKDGMTLDQQVEALYNYVFRNIRYVNASNKEDWRSEAVRGLTTGIGDCFTSYAAMRLLLEHTDAEYMSVERFGSTRRHYWLIVNLGSGWYHLDPSHVSKAKNRCFMWTNEQTQKIDLKYWRYDESLYPPIATEPYKKGK